MLAIFSPMKTTILSTLPDMGSLVEFRTYNPINQKNPHRWCPDTTHNYPLPEENVRRFNSINFPSFPSKTMPEFTIDKDIKQFIYDMTAYLRYQVQLTEQEQAHLILLGVKGTAKGFDRKSIPNTKTGIQTP